MAEQENSTSIFRQKALDALGRVDQFDETIQITPPHAWALLSACALILFAVLVWGVYGSITINVTGGGVLLPSKDFRQTKRLDAIVYIPASTAKRIKPDQKVLVTPSHISASEYGNIYGRVVSVGDYPASKKNMLAALKNSSLVQHFSQIPLAVEVKIRLLQDPSTYSGFKWSSSTGPKQAITPGTLVNVHIQIDQQTPISYILPALK